MVILYEVHNNLYVNMTNRCPCACTFCLRQDRDEMNRSGSLWLEREPAERMEDLLRVAAYAKEHFHIAVRVNTNGLSDLIYDKDTAPMFEGLVDTVSISLNTPDSEKYLKLTRNRFGIQSHAALLRFAGNVSKDKKLF